MSLRQVTLDSGVIYNDEQETMRMIEIAIGVILLGGAAWATVRTYKGRGISSIFVLAFAIFLVALGLSFLFGAFGALVRDLRFGSEWLK
jgi:ABC-type polysaccharide/polyol phosphate export permease